jgi:hypothetical protein
VYSTYLGGSGDEQGHGIAVDTAGNAYVSGITSSPDFPTLNAFQPRQAGSRAGSTSAFVTSLDPTGQLRYSTYLGGSSGADSGGGIAVDGAGNAYVTGWAGSTDFPTVNAFQPTFGGGTGVLIGDAFVTKFSADGASLVYSTYLGGRGLDYGTRIAVDQHGQVFVTGMTLSLDFPTLNAIQPRWGGSQDAFVASLDPTGQQLLYSTYLGGSFIDFAQGMAVDASGNVYVTGSTYSANFPTVNAFQPTLKGTRNAFVAKISPTPGPAAQLQVSAPAQVTSGIPLDITITAQDANGRTAVSYQGTVTLSTTDTDPGVVLPANYTFTAADQGVHTFSGGCTLITAGNQTLTATDTSEATITGTATITVNAGP